MLWWQSVAKILFVSRVCVDTHPFVCNKLIRDECAGDKQNQAAAETKELRMCLLPASERRQCAKTGSFPISGELFAKVEFGTFRRIFALAADQGIRPAVT